MLRYLPYLLLFPLVIYAFVDCLRTPEYTVRGMPKAAWLLLILLLGPILLGPLAWLLIGRPHRGWVRTGAGYAGSGPLSRAHRPGGFGRRGFGRRGFGLRGFGLRGFGRYRRGAMPGGGLPYGAGDPFARQQGPARESRERPQQPEGWIPPDDNPEFLRALGEQIRGRGRAADGE